MIDAAKFAFKNRQAFEIAANGELVGHPHAAMGLDRRLADESCRLADPDLGRGDVFLSRRIIFIELDRRKQQHLEESRFKAVEVTNFLVKSLDVTKAHISGVAALFKASNEVTENEFHDFVQQPGVFEGGSDLRAIAIVPEMAPDQRLPLT